MLNVRRRRSFRNQLVVSKDIVDFHQPGNRLLQKNVLIVPLEKISRRSGFRSSDTGGSTSSTRFSAEFCAESIRLEGNEHGDERTTQAGQRSRREPCNEDGKAREGWGVGRPSQSISSLAKSRCSSLRNELNSLTPMPSPALHHKRLMMRACESSNLVTIHRKRLTMRQKWAIESTSVCDSALISRERQRSAWNSASPGGQTLP